MARNDRAGSEQETRVSIDAKTRAPDVDNKVLAAISHEMRTPLNSICGFLELLSGSELNERQARWLALATIASDHLRGLIDSVQNYTGFDVRATEIVSEPVDVDALAYETIALIEPIASARHIDVYVDHDGATPLVVLADRSRLRQVFLNLLSNGIKFGPPGTTVTITTRRVGAAARVEIRDEGEGIEPTRVDRIFTPFDRLDAGNGAGGLGLGLALSRGLMHIMGGTLEFVSTPDPGALFRLELPAIPPARIHDPGSREPGGRTLAG